MKENIGYILKEIRKEKKITIKELSNTRLSSSQLSNIEKSIHIPSSDKLIHLLSMLNITYDEFSLLIEDDYLICKKILGERFIELGNSGNTKELKKIAEDCKNLYIEYNDIYFKHLELQILAAISLHENNFDFTEARIITSPIKNYLGKIENWRQYELSLFNNCLFIFNIDEIIYLEKRSLDAIENNFDINRNKDLMCILLNNLASYVLDYKEYYNRSLKYTSLCEELASFSQNTTQIIRAKILKQVTYYKLNSSKFSKKKLESLVQVFLLADLENIHSSFCKFLKKHEIDLDI